jgi:hypothetical protein
MQSVALRIVAASLLLNLELAAASEGSRFYRLKK